MVFIRQARKRGHSVKRDWFLRRLLVASAIVFLAKPLPKRHHSFLARIFKRAQSHVLSLSQKFFSFRHCRSLVVCMARSLSQATSN